MQLREQPNRQRGNPGRTPSYSANHPSSSRRFSTRCKMARGGSLPPKFFQTKRDQRLMIR